MDKEVQQMETVDVQREALGEVELLGRTGYFTGLRVDRGTVPEGMHCYELRHGSDDSFPVSVEENVRVNYFGAVLLTETLELGEGKALQLGCEDFGYAGGQVRLSQLMGKEPGICEIAGAELVDFLKASGNPFQMDGQEAELLIRYMKGHGYVVGQKEGQLYCGDLCAEADRVAWEETTVDDLVNSASEWNYSLVQEARAGMENPDDFVDFADKRSRYEGLCADEKMLDAMFGRTKYSKELDALAVTLAEAFLQDMGREGGIDAAIQKMAEQIKAGEDLLPDVSPALKKNGGKTR